jgi:hypothetical protein
MIEMLEGVCLPKGARKIQGPSACPPLKKGQEAFVFDQEELTVVAAGTDVLVHFDTLTRKINSPQTFQLDKLADSTWLVQADTPQGITRFVLSTDERLEHVDQLAQSLKASLL